MSLSRIGITTLAAVVLQAEVFAAFYEWTPEGAMFRLVFVKAARVLKPGRNKALDPR